MKKKTLRKTVVGICATMTCALSLAACSFGGGDNPSTEGTTQAAAAGGFEKKGDGSNPEVLERGIFETDVMSIGKCADWSCYEVNSGDVIKGLALQHMGSDAKIDAYLEKKSNGGNYDIATRWELVEKAAQKDFKEIDSKTFAGIPCEGRSYYEDDVTKIEFKKLWTGDYNDEYFLTVFVRASEGNEADLDNPEIEEMLSTLVLK